MNKNILVIYKDIKMKNKLRRLLVRMNIYDSCEFKSDLLNPLSKYKIILTNINDFTYLGTFKMFVRKISNIPLLNILDEGDIGLFSLLDDKSFKTIKLEESKPAGIKIHLKDLEYTLTNQIHLTKREMEILSLIDEGHSVDAISLKLGISTKTVITHKRNLFLKADVHSINQLIIWSYNRI